MNELISADDSQVCFTLKPLWISDNLSTVYYVFDTPLIYIIQCSMATILQTVAVVRITAHFTHTSYWQMCLNSVSLSIFDLEVTTVEEWQLQFTLVEVTWQLTSKHINKSIIGSNVSMYRSQYLVAWGAKEAKGKFWSSWFKPCGMWHCLNW